MAKKKIEGSHKFAAAALRAGDLSAALRQLQADAFGDAPVKVLIWRTDASADGRAGQNEADDLSSLDSVTAIGSREGSQVTGRWYDPQTSEILLSFKLTEGWPPGTVSVKAFAYDAAVLENFLLGLQAAIGARPGSNDAPDAAVPAAQSSDATIAASAPSGSAERAGTGPPVRVAGGGGRRALLVLALVVLAAAIAAYLGRS